MTIRIGYWLNLELRSVTMRAEILSRGAGDAETPRVLAPQTVTNNPDRNWRLYTVRSA